jgi:predicted transcriptional regulator
MSIPADDIPRQAEGAPETADQKSARLVRERALIDEGLADIRAGRVIDFEDLDRWLDILDKDSEAPFPMRRQPRLDHR